MPSSDSSVRGLSRVIRLEGPDETCEHMMRRVDRDEAAQICRHLFGDLSDHTAGYAAGYAAGDMVGARGSEQAR